MSLNQRNKDWTKKIKIAPPFFILEKFRNRKSKRGWFWFSKKKKTKKNI